MQRIRAPFPAPRLHRFSAGGPSPAVRAARLFRLALPLAAGLAVAFIADAVLPPAAPLTPLSPLAPLPATESAPVAEGSAQTFDSVPPRPVQATEAVSAAGAVVAAVPTRSTRDDDLQARITRLLTNGKTPFSAVVVMEAHTGRILATAEYSTRSSAMGLATRPMAPAASVFKIITASALLEQGVSPAERVCFHGGKTRMREDNLVDNAKRDKTCLRFDDVLPMSANVAMAKLARQHLTPALLQNQAERWGFGHRNSEVASELASTALIPTSAFKFAETAAGFGDVQLSALQGATMASIVANDGLLVPPREVVGGMRKAPVRVVSSTTARALRQMMTDAVSQGTGRKAFSAHPVLPVSAAGKTGSLTNYQTGLDTSWFIGFAPAEAPELIVAAVVVNTSKWTIKAPWLAKESLRLALREHGPAKASARVASR